MLTDKFSLIALSMLIAVPAAMAESFSTVEYIKVKRSVPIYSTIQEEVPSEQCYDVNERVDSGTGSNDVAAAVVGGALGGIVGHQIGKGTGKTVATVGGAVLGTLAGQKVASNYGTNAQPEYRTVRRCETVRTLKNRRVMDGYTNYAKFKGREIAVESDRPLNEIPVTVTYNY